MVYESIEVLKDKWGAKASEEYIKNIFRWALDILGFIFSLILFVLSVKYFNGWLEKTKSIKFLLICGIIQIGIFSTLFVFSMWNTYLVTFLAYLMPGVWLYQVVIAIVKFVESRKHLKSY